MADKIRMNFQAVDEMIDALTGAEDNMDEIYARLDGYQKSIKDGALEGRSGDSLAEAFGRFVSVAGMIGYALRDLKDDVKKARDEMQQATKAQFTAGEEGSA